MYQLRVIAIAVRLHRWKHQRADVFEFLEVDMLEELAIKSFTARHWRVLMLECDGLQLREECCLAAVNACAQELPRV